LSRLPGRLHARLGAGVFDGAIRDYARGELRRHTGWHRAALAVSFLVLTVPLLIDAAGISLMAIDFPNILTLFVGAVLVWAGWTLRPRRRKEKERGLTRAELPATFALLDRIAEALGTNAPEEIVLDAEFNASIYTQLLVRNPPTRLTIGLTLWAALDEGERIAVLAHELGHRVNGDSARYGPVALAGNVIETWIGLVGPDAVVSHDDQIVYASSGSLATDIVTTPSTRSPRAFPSSSRS
jgi:Zn-dependent protease with chaperone function